jgi:L-ascorbate metabolism protein UlaG (beta-lactamase superfamily)
MIITYHGGGCVKLQYGDTTILCNPPSKNSPWKSVRATADVVLSSVPHPDFSGYETISGRGEEEPFIIDGPGEYETGGIFFRGYPSKSVYEGTPRVNTTYLFSFDDMNVAFLGALSASELDTGFLEAADDISLLFVPVGAGSTLDPGEAYELSVKLQPNVIIPILFDSLKDPSLAHFAKEAGVEVKGEEKYTVKRKDITDLENHVVILESQN